MYRQNYVYTARYIFFKTLIFRRYYVPTVRIETPKTFNIFYFILGLLRAEYCYIFKINESLIPFAIENPLHIISI